MATLVQPETRPLRLAKVAKRGLFVLGAVLVAVAFLLGTVGLARPAMWLALSGLPWGLLLLQFPTTRARVLGFLQSRWAALAGDTPSDSARRLQAALLFVTLPAGWFFLSNNRNAGTGDTWPVVPTAASVVRTGSGNVGRFVSLAPPSYYLAEEQRMYCLVPHGAGWYSAYPLGMVPFALPSASAQAMTGLPLQFSTLPRLEKWSAAWVAAASLGLFFLLALRLSNPLTAAVATGLLAVGSTFTTTLAQGLWQQSGVVFWGLLALWVEFQPGARARSWGTVVQGLALAMMLACRLSAAVFVVPFGVWLLVRTPGRAFAVAGVALLGYAPWMALHWTIFGNPFGPSVGQLDPTLWGADIPGGLAGVLFSPGRGLFVYQPWLILVPVGLYLGSRAASRTAPPAGWRIFVLVFVVLHVLLVASWVTWWGGDCWGSRLLSEAVAPLMLLALPAVTWLLQSRAGHTVLGAFVLLAVFLHVREMYYPTFWEGVYKGVPATELMWTWARAPFLTPPYH
jgi:hypothetical protein